MVPVAISRDASHVLLFPGVAGAPAPLKRAAPPPRLTVSTCRGQAGRKEPCRADLQQEDLKTPLGSPLLART